jgi:hypothetical protein
MDLLPKEILFTIFQSLDPCEVAICASVCRLWCHVAEVSWKSILILMSMRLMLMLFHGRIGSFGVTL